MKVPPGFACALDRGWRDGQAELSAALPRVAHVIVRDSSQCIEFDRPNIVVHAIRRVVNAVRAGQVVTVPN